MLLRAAACMVCSCLLLCCRLSCCLHLMQLLLLLLRLRTLLLLLLGLLRLLQGAASGRLPLIAALLTGTGCWWSIFTIIIVVVTIWY
jgi:hypothetical protein